MNDRKNQTVAVLAVVVFVIFAWDLGRRQALNSLTTAGDSSERSAAVENDVYPYENSERTSVEDANQAGQTFILDAGGESVNVADQPAGMEVKISSLSLSEMGWVGVRDSEGRVLGAGRFDAGSFKNVSVPLLRATAIGESYQVLLYADDGDRQFDLHKDVLVTGPYGGVAGTNFKAL